MSIGDDELHAFEPAAGQVLEETRPERLGLAGTDVQADNLALALGVDRDRHCRRDTDNRAALADLEVGRVRPRAGPVARQRSLEASGHLRPAVT